MDSFTQTILGGIVIQAIALLFVFFKTIPVMQSQLSAVSDDIERQYHLLDSVKNICANQTVTLAEHKKDYENIKREFDEYKISNKEIISELKTTVQECTKVLIKLEGAIQSLKERL